MTGLTLAMPEAIVARLQIRMQTAKMRVRR